MIFIYVELITQSESKIFTNNPGALETFYGNTEGTPFISRNLTSPNTRELLSRDVSNFDAILIILFWCVRVEAALFCHTFCMVFHPKRVQWKRMKCTILNPDIRGARR